MCSIEPDEICSVWSTTWQMARKPHRCVCCGVTIDPGHRYLKHFSVFDGEASTDKACIFCGTMWESFIAAHGAGYAPNMLEEMLDECVADNRRFGGYRQKSSLEQRMEGLAQYRPLDAQWRRYLCILKYRQRQACRSKGDESGNSRPDRQSSATSR